MFIWTIHDAIEFGALGVFLLIALVVWIARAVTRVRCLHDSGVRETMACDAICRKCGANLGFIGNLTARKEIASEAAAK